MRPVLQLPLLLLFGALLSAGCVKVSELEVIPSPTPIPPDRGDCAEYFGTAFRSETERQWFTENCSAWDRATLGVVQPAPPAAPVAPAPAPTARPAEDPRCAQMRGQPYANDADRAWFLANCTGNAARNSAPQAFDQGPDRVNCDEIRGTNYRSANERNWFLQNCLVRP
jgi:hypothetical protein